MVEGLEDVGATLVADSEPTVAAEPGQRTLHDPTVPAQTLAALDATTGDPRGDATAAAGLAAATVVVGLVGVQLGRPSTRPPDALPDRRHGVDQGLEEPAVVGVGWAEANRERDTVRVHDDMALGPGLAAVGRVRTRKLAPLLAGTEALSRLARPQSIAFARPKRSSRTWCSRAQMPALCQSRSRRQQLMPHPQPISCGSISQGMPDLRTKRMPVSAARFGTGGRPPFGRGLGGGSRGSISAHSASLTSGLAMPDQPIPRPTVPGSVRRSNYSQTGSNTVRSVH